MIGCATERKSMTHVDSVSVNDVVLDAVILRQIIVETLTGNGASAEDAAVQADILVEGDLRDQHSHGVRRLPVLVERLRNGLVRSGHRMDSDWVSDAVLRLDGQRSFGPVAAYAAIEAIVDRARTTGIAMSVVRNSNHIGMLAPYVEKVSSAGLIGIALTTSEALVHPWNGTRALIGTNPVGIAIPTATEPLVLDMSTAAVSMGKVLDQIVMDRPIPLGWAVDRDGNPTTDAIAASQGALSPFGGSKGYALGIALEALVAILTSTALGTAVRGTLDSKDVASKGDVFIAISIERLGSTAMLPVVQAYLDEVRASGQDGRTVTIPGDRARATREVRLRDGVLLHPEIWAQVERLYEEVRDA
jgi:LDH2 family malate/lactate/ureidoglycolate dehydrogenase